MRKFSLLTAMMVLSLMTSGQFADNFDDGNFTTNPEWVGTVDKFMIDDGMLRLNNSVAGQAYLSSGSRIIHNTQWDFYVRLAFTPSNNNHPRIYLVSDNADLSGPLNGYFLRIGKDGGDQKRFFFYRQDGMEVTELMAGNANLANTTNNRLRIRVTRDGDGHWSFFADPAGGVLFAFQGEAFDDTYTETSWFGVRCLYTVSNANRFYFDDMNVGEITEDREPPQISRVEVAAANVLDVYFDEVVEVTSAEDTGNYFVDEGIGHPVLASRNQVNPGMVSLIFSGNFAVNQNYRIVISNVEDNAGNAMPESEAGFVNYQPQRFDVVFNELMVNPVPVVGLPAHEYIELHNTTDFQINLESWVLQHGNTKRTLPVAHIPPKGLLLLVAEAAFPLFQDAGNVVAVPALSSTALTNAGTDLMLFDPGNQLISFVSYKDTWYGDPSRSNGGWSLEKIDPSNFCQGAENWKASTDPAGGTPGRPNAVMAGNPDTTQPGLIRAGVEDDRTIFLVFSEPMDAAGLENTGHYTVTPAPGQLLSAEALLPDFSRVRLLFDNLLQPGVEYRLAAGDQLTDCAGNTLKNNTVVFGLPQLAKPNDVVINEVLFNPPENGARYVEIYNRADRIIDLKDYLLTSKDTMEGHLTTIQEISTESFLVFPEDYMVLTQNPAAVRNTYMTPNPEAFITMPGMPRMTNTNGIIVFATRSLQEIDLFAYSEDMHLPLLTNYKGVALERVNPDRPASDRSNWHSASQGAGFGTPGYKNSQFTLNVLSGTGSIDVYPEVFSPDGDGNEDLLNISYNFDQPGYVANIRIFDARGRLITHLRKSELLATSGVITWNGITDGGQKALIGIYIIHVELFDVDGNVQQWKKSAVLGGRL